ncbi:holo-ACP synthase [Pseudobutyrivibrio sp.]|jgi:holo-[acyl-carrier protein] synthase|uniref:holo-ACP synthase n=1 Tax=Pseudobutyrivibrio sp. TaxID=2014367 RepID=UPI001D6A69AC|nr:holo-ACP synthase [Pseudobutyrivibrio sp.]MBE5910267.1 holo-ACP synthase [Pseudobutyrivibrio sp.]
MSNVLGVGIDLVSISEIKDLDERTHGAFVDKTYTDGEKEDANATSDFYQFLAGRFAVKEAVFKAICGNFTDIEFDFRQVETRRMPNGAPKFVPSIELLKILNDIGASDILISISNQGDSAIAIAELIK